ncbi:hypothetical protein ACN28E_53905 [Archangium lansingense]|uniref:hypothetical protein n=1 Tax=Archangium lansingense TaxID=2995310 RepID=UPI003B7E13E8
MGKKRKRSDQHLTDIEDFPDKHKPACLNAHHGAYTDGHTCSYRWQGYLKAKSDTGFYTWPKDYGLQPPSGQNWNIGHPGNFQDKCTVPYWHESHHIIPHAELTNAIAWVGGDAPKASEIKLTVRGGLLDEAYNLNDQINMIILPMLALHARAVGLPKHRMTPTTFHHSAYSKVVLKQVKDIFQPMQEKASKHELPDYVQSKKQLEALSKSLYEQIKSAGQLMKKGVMAGDSLDDVKENHLLAKPPPKSTRTSINDPLT